MKKQYFKIGDEEVSPLFNNLVSTRLLIFRKIQLESSGVLSRFMCMEDSTALIYFALDEGYWEETGRRLPFTIESFLKLIDFQMYLNILLYLQQLIPGGIMAGLIEN